MRREAQRFGVHNMKLIRILKIATSVAAIHLAGCSTITFENSGNVEGATSTYEKWHHIWAFDLYEGSKPVNLEATCSGKQWQTVTTETSFLNGFTEIFTSPVWYPESVSVNCSALEKTSSLELEL